MLTTLRAKGMPMIRTMLAALLLLGSATVAAEPLPHLDGRHLIVDGEPWLLLGGELANSSASSRAWMAPRWDRLAQLHLNTVLMPVSWELVEPEQGRFDFALVDGLLADARAHDMRVVLLWFGTWKNSRSSYAPAWV
jgi:beta-galactosidase GanA